MDLHTWLTARNVPAAEALAVLMTVTAIALITALFYLALRFIARKWIPALAARTPTQWDVMLVRRGVFLRLAAFGPALLAHALAGVWMGPASGMAAAGEVFRLAMHLWLLAVGLLIVHAVLNGILDIYNTLSFARQMPIRGFIQVIQLVATIVVIIIAISLLLGRSPALLISGFGAMTAVLMLVFKDPILGFVAGIQLSANRMLAVGDWLEMPRYNADGDVIDITLTTVKVRNWDQTITTVPTYALISDSFKNWRGMSEAGGRRIKRSVFVDMTSVRFLGPDDVERLRRAQLLSHYLAAKIEDIERYNREHGADPASPMNGRRLTNLGTFRAYLAAYLEKHPGIHQGMIHMVRQLQPTPEGLPIELYAFTRDIDWIAHEQVQSDIFDHVLAVAPEFGLRVFQSPMGADIREAAGRWRDGPERITRACEAGDRAPAPRR